MKIITVLGARPQFVKASAVSRAISQYNDRYPNRPIEEILLHTGQHYDEDMSAVFFNQLDIPPPAYNLGIAEKTHGAMTGKMLEMVEKVLMDEIPDVIIVYGDTNSTLAGALAGAKLCIPVAHIEAGLRSFSMDMPEEINRILTDRISKLLFCPTETAVKNLANEGIKNGVYNVGDVMYDATMFYRQKAQKQFSLDRWNIEKKKYVLCTIHRAENTDDRKKLKDIFSALQEIANDFKVIIPLHPRTRKRLSMFGLNGFLQGINILDPVSYLEMIRLEISANAIITDSGGIQKEAFFHNVPCLTLRDETEWIETIDMGWNRLCAANKKSIIKTWNDLKVKNEDFESIIPNHLKPYGDGKASHSIVGFLASL